MIEIQNLHKYYKDLHVLKGVNLKISSGEIISIVGASGAGKTTLLHIMGTLVNYKPLADTIVKINDNNMSDLSPNQLAQFRNQNIGFVFQFHQLLMEFSALENVMIPGLIGNRPKKVVKERALELLDTLGLSHRIDHKPDTLSGGEQQRVAVARALINNPKVLLADEPSGNLDSESAENLHQLFFKLREQFKQTIVLVTHNEGLANLVDRKLTMVDGLIQE